MAKCTACRKEFNVPVWKFATLCPECKAAQLEMKAKLRAITPTFIVTPCLVGLNVLVFIAMVVSGVSVMEPDLGQLVHWGANFGPRTLGAQPWRLLTGMFVHIGIIHILFNMWCLWTLGELAERLLGNVTFLILYLLSGVGGSILSLWLHPQLVSAGASGAIFGVAGGMVALLGLKKAQIPGAQMQQQFKSLLFFIGYNLLYGMRGGIDNAAHLGGLVSGAALGALMPRRQLETTPVAGSSPFATDDSAGPNTTPFKLAALAIAAILFLGFGWVRRTYDPSKNIVQQELISLPTADRKTLQEAAKQVANGKADDQTFAALQTVATHAPNSSLVHMILAEAYYQKEKYDLAIPEYQKVVALRPKDVSAHVELGSVFLKTRQNDQAITEYRAALRLAPRDPRAHNNLGVALERNGDAKGALEEYRTASTYDPQNATYKKNLDRLSKPAVH